MLRKTCKACNKDRKKSKLSYDSTLNAYCLNSHECNSEHPNSTVNLIRNGKLTELFNHDEAIELFAKTFKRETIKHMGNPITIRLTDVSQAVHLENKCTEQGVTISDYIRSLIVSDMQTVQVVEKQEPTKKENDEEWIF